MGVAVKTAKDLFRAERESWLDSARAEAVKLLKSGKPYVTIDDITAIVPRPTYLHKNVTGSVFKDEQTFVWCGVEKSKRPLANGRLISRWKLKNEK